MNKRNSTNKEQKEIDKKATADQILTIGYFETVIELRLDKRFDEKLARPNRPGAHHRRFARAFRFSKNGG